MRPKQAAASDMSLAESSETLKPRGRSWQRIPWFGGLFIAAIAAMAVWDVVRAYRVAADDTDRELETQARVIAEQTARSVGAVDVVLRHVAAEYKRGRLARLSAPFGQRRLDVARDDDGQRIVGHGPHRGEALDAWITAVMNRDPGDPDA